MKRTVLFVVMVLLLTAGNALAFDVVGYPWSTWGEVSGDLTNSKLKEGFKIDGYIEQGVDWFKVGPLVIDTFVGLRGTASSQTQDYWNNKVGPWVGAKAKFPLSTGEIAVGVRYEYYHYMTDAYGNEGRAVAFVTWGFNGDWKKKKE
jgi:hypothetical protein